MKRNIDLKEITGKTIEGFVLSFINNELLISFKDDTFIVIGVRKDLYEDDYSIMSVEFNVYDFLEESLVELSVYSVKELTDLKEGIQNRNETLARIAERVTYERLKIKYEKLEG